MYENGSRHIRYPGMADSDYPTEAQIERRRQRDIEFLQWVRTANPEELVGALPTVKGWRAVAIQRALGR